LNPKQGQWLSFRDIPTSSTLLVWVSARKWV
jgi:hypothetical protein